MCGICGIVSKTVSEHGKRVVAEMLSTLKHRGPDSQTITSDQTFCFGHARLSIIDIAGGKQPMQTPDKRFTIVFNGEIYNYLELRQELMREGFSFLTFSDTEVLLNLWARDQENALSRLNGMFAFAIFDNVSQNVTLVRDHFGIKPLYYYLTSKNQLVFASEIKALLRHPDIVAEIDHAGLADYLVFQFCLDNLTLFKGIKKLEPGHLLSFSMASTDKPIIRQWWGLNYDIDTHHTEEYFNDNILMLLQSSVNMQLRSDVPVGAYLSGGLDSSTIATLGARNYSGTFHCFHGRFEESPAYDESQYARIVTEHIGAELHIATPTAEDFVSRLPNIIYALDEPLAGPGVFPQFMVSELAKQHVTVVLGGTGGDEVFGGYARYLVSYLEQALKGAIFETQNEGRFVVTLESMIPNLPVLQQYTPMMRSFFAEGMFDEVHMRYLRLVARNDGLRSLLSHDIWSTLPLDAIPGRFEAIFNSPESPSSINRMLHFDQKTLLPALLHIEDRASMTSSLESRVPLLDHRLVELANNLPPTIKFKAGKLKYSLLKSAKSLLPDKVVQRKDKMGFPVPLSEWSQSGEVRDFTFDILGDARTKQRGIYAKSTIDKILHDPSPYGRKLWGALCLELWFREFID